MSSDKPRFSGVVEAAKGNGFFTVNVVIGSENISVLCQLSGKMRTNNIKVVVGDQVDIEIDTYDKRKGRILFRKR